MRVKVNGIHHDAALTVVELIGAFKSRVAFYLCRDPQYR